ncbi:MAG: ABC transporter ATP-binding protein/permease [Candidatus Accumulibacter sp.]|nr:ABC transporter ATP-binding protein/permease [Accumulibacter sp.]
MVFKLFENAVDPYPAAPPPVPPRGFTAFVWQCTEGMRGLIVGMMICTGVVGAFEALLFAMLGKVIDWLAVIEPARLWEEAGSRLLLLAGAIAASVGVAFLQTLIKHQALAGNFAMRLRWNFHRLLLGQSLSFFQDEFAGRVSAKVMQTALAVRDTCFIVTDILVFVVIYFVTLALVLGGFDGWMLAPLFGWLACYLCALRHFVPRLARVSREQADARASMTGRVTDAYTNIVTVKLFSHAGREAGYAREAMQEFLGNVHGMMRLVSGVEVVQFILSMGLVVATTGTAMWLWTRGEVGVGALAASSAMALRLNSMSRWIMWEMTQLFENVGTVQDGINTLSRRHRVTDRTDARTLAVERGEIRFERVGFSYGARDDDVSRRVIDGFDLRIGPGEKTGLVGRSGAGKSTLVNLLLRFHDPEAGRILIDGQDIAAVTQESLRARIGMVTQDTSLLHRSVRENILYGRPDADEARMRAAAARAEAHDFILALTDPKGRRGYDAHVGERGVKLSGGQRQRIAIARVMLKDAPILLLDEATSALDSEVEEAIQKSLYRLMEGKTVVAIAHRLSTIAAMDRLIVIDHGRIVEEGNHRSLLARGGLYARLWARQSGGFLGDGNETDEMESRTAGA